MPLAVADLGGLGGCIYGSLRRKSLRKDLNIPEKYEIMLVLALGKPAEQVEIETVGEDGEDRGISAFIIDAEADGYHRGKLEPKLGIRASATCEIELEDYRCPVEDRIGAEGQGFKIARTPAGAERCPFWTGGLARQDFPDRAVELLHFVGLLDKPVAATLQDGRGLVFDGVPAGEQHLDMRIDVDELIDR